MARLAAAMPAPTPCPTAASKPAALRGLMAAISLETPPTVTSGHPALDREIGGGWPLGQVVELCCAGAGWGEVSLCLPALATRGKVAWVLPPGRQAQTNRQAYAPALGAHLRLADQLLIQTDQTRDAAWAAEQVLRSGAVGGLLAWLPATSPEADFRLLRRLQLQASRHACLTFVWRESKPAAASPAALRIEVRGLNAAGEVELQLLKRRGAPLPAPVSLSLHPRRWAERQAFPALFPFASDRRQVLPV